MTTVADPVDHETEQQNSANFAEKAAEVKNLLAELATLAPGVASEQLAALKNSASWLYQGGAKRIRDAGTKVVETVKRRPAETVLVGLGLGLLTWWLLAQRRADGAGQA